MIYYMILEMYASDEFTVHSDFSEQGCHFEIYNYCYYTMHVELNSQAYVPPCIIAWKGEHLKMI